MVSASNNFLSSAVDVGEINIYKDPFTGVWCRKTSTPVFCFKILGYYSRIYVPKVGDTRVKPEYDGNVKRDPRVKPVDDILLSHSRDFIILSLSGGNPRVWVIGDPRVKPVDDANKKWFADDANKK